MKRTLFGLGILGLSAVSSAGLTFTGVNDYSAEVGRAPGGKVDAEIEVLAGGLFLNSAGFGASGNLGSSGLFIDTSNTRFDRNDGSLPFDYIWGTPLSSGFTYRSQGAGDGLFGFFGSAAAPGIYTGTVDIFGGATSTSTDFLGSADVSVEVLNSFGVTVTYSQNSFLVNPGQVLTKAHTLSNSSSRDALIQTRYVTYPSVPDGFSFDFSSSYPTQLNAGSTVTSDHINITGINPAGVPWVSDSGPIIGFYGDDYNFVSGGPFTIQAVPEPATLAILGLGGALIARRRRKN